MTTTETAIGQLQFGAPITAEQLPPLQGRELALPTQAVGGLIRKLATASAHEHHELAGMIETFGLVTESALIGEEGPHEIYRAPAEQWQLQREKPLLKAFLKAQGLGADQRLRDDPRAQGDPSGTVVYLGAHRGKGYLLVEREKIAGADPGPQIPTDRLWQLWPLPSIPPNSRRREAVQIAERRQKIALDVVNALSLREAGLVAVTLSTQRPPVSVAELEAVLLQADRRTVRKPEDAVRILEKLREEPRPGLWTRFLEATGNVALVLGGQLKNW